MYAIRSYYGLAGAVAWRHQGRLDADYLAHPHAGGHGLGGAAERAHQHPLKGRITSYNVCYTKLLRAGGAVLVQLGEVHGARTRLEVGDHEQLAAHRDEGSYNFV